MKSSLNFEVLEFAIISFVSSANRTGLNESAVIFGRSFIQSKKNKGPSMEPWGTLCFILPRSEKVVLLEELLFISPCVVGPCHHGMARPQVADRGTASNMEGSCE